MWPHIILFWLYKMFFKNVNFAGPHFSEIIFFSKLLSHIFVRVWSVIWLQMLTELCKKAIFCVTEHNFVRLHIILWGILTEYSNIQDIFIQVLNNHAPTKTKSMHFNNSSFMTKTLRKAFIHRSRLKHIYFLYIYIYIYIYIYTSAK